MTMIKAILTGAATLTVMTQAMAATPSLTINVKSISIDPSVISIAYRWNYALAPCTLTTCSVQRNSVASFPSAYASEILPLFQNLDISLSGAAKAKVGSPFVDFGINQNGTPIWPQSCKVPMQSGNYTVQINQNSCVISPA